MRGPLLLILVAGTGLVVAISLATSRRLTAPLARLWHRRGSFVRWYVGSAPVTFVYLGILAVTSWVLLGMPDFAEERYLEAQSTDLAHLTRDPLRVLFRSAFFVTGWELAVWAVLFTLLMAPVERWIGSARTIAVFAVGHVGATLLTAVDIWLHIHLLRAPASLWTVTDTGASYGFAALTALLVYRLRGTSRLVLALVLAALVVYGAIEGTGYTARGHALAILIGLALHRVTRTEQVRDRVGPGASLRSLWLRRTADGENVGRSSRETVAVAPVPAAGAADPSAPAPPG